jgi:Holliday junction resolvase
LITNYQKGDHFEKRVLGDLRTQGYVAWQTRGSKSPADIIALKSGQVLLVQVKSGAGMMAHEDWNTLYDLAERVAGHAILAERVSRKIRYRRLDGWHRFRSRYWPCEPFLLDEVIS